MCHFSIISFAYDLFTKDKMPHFKKYCKNYRHEHLKHCYVIKIHKVHTSTAIFGVLSNH